MTNRQPCPYLAVVIGGAVLILATIGTLLLY
jgi:hypothetical protein